MTQLTSFKEAAKATWATGDYDAMMRREGLYEVGGRITRRVGAGPGDRVLDIACGTGCAAIPAARAGAQVTGADLTPEMLRVARRRAEAVGAEVDWVEGDAEDLPFESASFDVVLSTFGCMFAPRGEVVADEAARVLRQGGRLGICAWTPEGAIGAFFGAVAPYLPPPPEVADSPLQWGEEERVRELLEGTGVELEFARETWDIEHDSVDDAVTFYTTLFGPVVVARELADAEGRGSDLRRDLAALFARFSEDGSGRVTLPAEYLVIVGRKAS